MSIANEWKLTAFCIAAIAALPRTSFPDNNFASCLLQRRVATGSMCHDHDRFILPKLRLASCCKLQVGYTTPTANCLSSNGSDTQHPLQTASHPMALQLLSCMLDTQRPLQTASRPMALQLLSCMFIVQKYIYMQGVCGTKTDLCVKKKKKASGEFMSWMFLGRLFGHLKADSQQRAVLKAGPPPPWGYFSHLWS